MGAFSMAGNTPLVVQPMILGAMVDQLGLSERQAGMVASVELVGLTLGILGLIRVMSTAPRVALAMFAVGTIVAADIMTCFVSSFAWLLPIRFLSGTGAGRGLLRLSQHGIVGRAPRTCVRHRQCHLHRLLRHPDAARSPMCCTRPAWRVC